MGVPLATTTLTVRRPGAAEPYETADYTTVAAGVAGHISGGGGVERQGGGSEEDTTRSFGCDVADIAHEDQVVDDTTGLVYEVVWVERRAGLGLDRMTGELRRVQGAGS